MKNSAISGFKLSQPRIKLVTHQFALKRKWQVLKASSRSMHFTLQLRFGGIFTLFSRAWWGPGLTRTTSESRSCSSVTYSGVIMKTVVKCQYKIGWWKGNDIQYYDDSNNKHLPTSCWRCFNLGRRSALATFALRIWSFSHWWSVTLISQHLVFILVEVDDGEQLPLNPKMKIIWKIHFSKTNFKHLPISLSSLWLVITIPAQHPKERVWRVLWRKINNQAV